MQAVSREGILILFDDSRSIIASQDISLLLNESSKLIDTVASFLQKNNTSYSDIQNIAVVHGPGSFTGIRTISLYVNTIAFIHPHLTLSPVIYFDLFSSYPVCKTSSKRDLFVKRDKNAIIEVVKNDDFLSDYREKQVYGDAQLEGLTIDNTVDYNKFLKTIELQSLKKIAPIYIKKPNIS